MAALGCAENRAFVLRFRLWTPGVSIGRSEIQAEVIPPKEGLTSHSNFFPEKLHWTYDLYYCIPNGTARLTGKDYIRQIAWAIASRDAVFKHPAQSNWLDR